MTSLNYEERKIDALDSVSCCLQDTTNMLGGFETVLSRLCVAAERTAEAQASIVERLDSIGVSLTDSIIVGGSVADMLEEIAVNTAPPTDDCQRLVKAEERMDALGVAIDALATAQTEFQLHEFSDGSGEFLPTDDSKK